MSDISSESVKLVQVFGRKKNAIALARLRQGKGQIRVNGMPIENMSPPILQMKLAEPIRLLGVEDFTKLSLLIRVRGGGPVSQVYAVRQAIAKSMVAHYAAEGNREKRDQAKRLLSKYDKYLLVADSRKREMKKYGGPGARARYQKSYR